MPLGPVVGMLTVCLGLLERAGIGTVAGLALLVLVLLVSSKPGDTYGLADEVIGDPAGAAESGTPA
ncbi:hypothetical protein [Dactylosporangium sp. NPDC006015]|uniref:hypothetical protein n=1 Tax=unclassified Dactylosporangium TaxID=2621675 RepID=UPI0033AD7249